MLYDSFKKVYICDFKILEDELLGTDKYVSIDKKNYKTFSSKYMQLFLSICSGIDSLAEEFCSALDESNNVKNKRSSMLQRFQQIKNYGSSCIYVGKRANLATHIALSFRKASSLKI